MNHDRLRASYILRLTQRLSRLSFELRDVRTGLTRRFGTAKDLSRFLDACVTDGVDTLPTAPSAGDGPRTTSAAAGQQAQGDVAAPTRQGRQRRGWDQRHHDEENET